MVTNTVSGDVLANPAGEAADRIRSVLGSFDANAALAALTQVTGEWRSLTAGEHNIDPNVARSQSAAAQENHAQAAELQAESREYFVACYAASPIAISAAKLAVKAVEARTSADKRAVVAGKMQGFGPITSLVDAWARRGDSRAYKMLEKAHIAKSYSDTVQDPIVRGVQNIDPDLGVLDVKSNGLNARADRIKRGIDKGAKAIPLEMMWHAVAAAETVEAELAANDKEIDRLHKSPKQSEPRVMRRAQINVLGARISFGPKRLRIDNETVAHLDRVLHAERRHDDLYHSEDPKLRKKATNLPTYAAYLGTEKAPAQKRLPDHAITRNYRPHSNRQTPVYPYAGLRLPMV